MVYDFLVIKARETSPTWNVFGSFAISRPSCTLQVGIKMFHQFCINSFTSLYVYSFEQISHKQGFSSSSSVKSWTSSSVHLFLPFLLVMVYDFLVIKARETSPTWNVFGSFAISRPSCTLQVGIKMFHQFCINSFTSLYVYSFEQISHKQGFSSSSSVKSWTSSSVHLFLPFLLVSFASSTVSPLCESTL